MKIPLIKIDQYSWSVSVMVVGNIYFWYSKSVYCILIQYFLGGQNRNTNPIWYKRGYDDRNYAMSVPWYDWVPI